jgi:hypothetical protein
VSKDLRSGGLGLGLERVNLHVLGGAAMGLL